jgi:hypothetical protein
VSYSLCIAQLKTTLAGVTGIKKVVNGYPTSLQAWPLIYMHADRGERAIPGGSQMTVNSYSVTATLCLPFQDNYIAEDGIAPFLNSIPAAVDANATLGDTCNVAYVTTWLADVREMGGTGDTAIRCRVVDFTVFIRDKGARLSGI